MKNYNFFKGKITSYEFAMLTNITHNGLMHNANIKEQSWIKEGQKPFECSFYINSSEQMIPMILLSEEECSFITSVLTASQFLSYKNRWRKHTKENSPQSQLPLPLYDKKENTTSEKLYSINTFSKFHNIDKKLFSARGMGKRVSTVCKRKKIKRGLIQEIIDGVEYSVRTYPETEIAAMFEKVCKIKITGKIQ